MTLQIRMTAICENEIVTLRGEVCLVRQGSIAEIEKKNLEPQRTRRNTEEKRDRGDQRLTAETRRRGEDRDIGKVIAKHQQNL